MELVLLKVLQCIDSLYQWYWIVWHNVIICQGSIYWGRQGGSFPPNSPVLPPPPKRIASDSTKVALVMSALIIQGLKLTLSKLSWIIKCQFLYFAQEGVHATPTCTPTATLSMMASPPPPNFES